MTETIQKKVVERLGLILRTGQMETGQESCVDLIRSGEAAIAFLDAAVSGNTRKRLVNACTTHQVPLFEMENGALGHAIGKPNRYAAAIRPGGLADKLLAILQDEVRLNADTMLTADNAGV